MTPLPLSAALGTARRAHVVVVGAGGLGCPAAWALAEAGVGRLTVIDPDRVEPSNLPRQVLFHTGDVGRPKAVVAAERLGGIGGDATRVTGLHARLDDGNEAELVAGADVLVDATDGARTKDWLNAVAVRRGTTLVHAAAVGSEGRLLEVPAGGRPCLACLFGRLSEETGGTCADLGVWGGVVGAVGFLAAGAALRRLAAPGAASPGYLVLDVEGGRAFTVGADAVPDCPVCGAEAPDAAEPYPVVEACAAAAGPPVKGAPAPAVLDLLEESCPVNLLRARRAVEALPPDAILEIHLGAEGAQSVPDGLRALGHAILVADRPPGGPPLRLRVRRGLGPRSAAPLTRDELLRYARQVVLPEVGEAGQRRLLRAEVEVAGRGPVAETTAVYLRAAGVGRVLRDEASTVPAVTLGGPGGRAVLGLEADGWGRLGVVLRARGDQEPEALEATPVPVGRALGALLADAACRRLVTGRATEVPPPIVLGTDGAMATRASSAARS